MKELPRRKRSIHPEIREKGGVEAKSRARVSGTGVYVSKRKKCRVNVAGAAGTDRGRT